MIVTYGENNHLHEPGKTFAPGANAFLDHPDTPERGFLLYKAMKEYFTPKMEQALIPEKEELMRVHSLEYIEFLYEYAEAYPGPGFRLPEFFPIRKVEKLPGNVYFRSGYYFTDMESPLNGMTFKAALESAGCALTGAGRLLETGDLVYALCRPPGHHAGRNFGGGFCYLNNAALAADLLTFKAYPALLDLDYHHGNGSQDIFYGTDKVLYASIHCSPAEDYPYFTGFKAEIGEGKGKGYNLNFPLPREGGKINYMTALDIAISIIKEDKRDCLVLSMGFNTLKSDKMGGLGLDPIDFFLIGRKIKELKLPTLIIQEGGYDLNSLTDCVVQFFKGLED